MYNVSRELIQVFNGFLEWEYASIVSTIIGVGLLSICMHFITKWFLHSGRRLKPNDRLNEASNAEVNVRQQRLQTLHNLSLSENNSNADQTTIITPEATVSTPKRCEENHKLRAVLSPSPTLSQVSSSVGCLSSPVSDSIADRKDPLHAVQSKRRRSIKFLFPGQPPLVSVSESLKSVYERERSSAAHPLRLSISLFARIVSARSSTLASTEEVNELKDAVVHDLSRDLFSSPTDLPLWAQGSLGTQNLNVSSASAANLTHTSIWDVVLDVCAGQEASASTLGYLLADLKSTQASTAAEAIIAAAVGPLRGLDASHVWDAPLLDLCRLSLMRLRRVMTPSVACHLASTLQQSNNPSFLHTTGVPAQLRLLTVPSTLHSNARQLISKANDAHIAQLLNGPKAVDILQPITDLRKAAVDCLFIILSTVSRYKRDGRFLFRDGVLSFLTCMHTELAFRLRSSDHSLFNDATFQQRLASSHGVSLNMMHVIIQLAMPIVISSDRAALVRLEYLDVYMARYYAKDLLPSYVHIPSDLQTAVAMQQEEERPVFRETYATQLIAVCISCMFITLPTAIDAFYKRTEAIRHRYKLSSTSANERRDLERHLTNLHLSWKYHILHDDFITDVLHFCVLALVRLCTTSSITHGGAATGIMTRISSRVIVFASTYSRPTLATAMTALSTEESTAFADWIASVLLNGRQDPTTAAFLTRALHALVIVPGRSIEVPQLYDSALIFCPSLEQLVRGLINTFEGLDVIIDLDVDKEYFDKYQVKSNILQFLLGLSNMESHWRSVDEIEDSVLEAFLCSLLQSLLFSLDSTTTRMLQAHLAEERTEEYNVQQRTESDRLRAQQLANDTANSIAGATLGHVSHLLLLRAFLTKQSGARSIARLRPLRLIASVITFLSTKLSTERRSELHVQHTSAASVDLLGVAVLLLEICGRFDDSAISTISHILSEDLEFSLDNFQVVAQDVKSRQIQSVDVDLIHNAINRVVAQVNQFYKHKENSASNARNNSSDSINRQIETLPLNIEELVYTDTLKSLSFAMADFGTDEKNHAFYSYVKEGHVTSAFWIRELRQLHRILPVHVNSSIFVRVDEGITSLLKALMSGPPDTPYAYGLFLFHLYIPPSYPSNPPQVRFLTNGNGRVRMNPNLYNNGAVCLSLLNTWHANDLREKWSSDSNLYQVLMALQTHMFVAKQMYNEPGQSTQLSQEDEEREHIDDARVLEGTLRYGILDMLVHPPNGFADVIRAHFSSCRSHLYDQLNKWKQDYQTSRTLLTLIDEVYSRMSAL